MVPTYQKILASIAIGLILPLLLYRFRVTPWSEPIAYWNVAILSFGVSILVYKYRQPREGTTAVRTHLTNFVISLFAVCVIALVYILILSALYASI